MPLPRVFLVFLLLAAAGSYFLTLPAEAADLPFADLVDTAARRHGVDPTWFMPSSPSSQGTARARHRRPEPRA